MTRLFTAMVVLVAALALLAARCDSGPNTFTLDAPERPLRDDLGDLAPAESRTQQLFDDVNVTLDMADGEQYTIETEQLWVVLDALLERPTDRGDDPVDFLEFQQTLGRDDADLIPALSELAAMVGYRFDEDAATAWVQANEDEQFSMEVKPLGPEAYGIYLNAEDDLNNTASIFIYFPDGSTGGSSTRTEPLFDGRLIDR